MIKKLAYPKWELKKYVLTSLVIHIIVLFIWVIIGFEKKTNSKVIIEPIEIELIDDKVSLKKYNPPKLPKIDNKLLPQLPKRYQITDEDKKDNSIESKRMTGHIINKTKIKKIKIAKKKKDINDNRINKLKKKEALKQLMKQLALEKLKKNKYKSLGIKDNELEESDEMGWTDQPSDIQEDFSKDFKIKIYKRRVANIVQSNWKYSNMMFKDIKRFVSVVIKITSKGNISKIDLEKSSGDEVFDKIVLNALEKSDPLPAPPKKLVLKIIRLNFKPPKGAKRESMTNG